MEYFLVGMLLILQYILLFLHGCQQLDKVIKKRNASQYMNISHEQHRAKLCSCLKYGYGYFEEYLVGNRTTLQEEQPAVTSGLLGKGNVGLQAYIAA